MIELPIQSGDSLIKLAQEKLGDASKWRDVADQNNLNPLQALPVGQILNVPDVGELTSQVQPILNGIAQGLNGVAGQIAATLETVETKLEGYAKEAKVLLGEVNGVLGEVESVVKQGPGALRDYKGEAVKLIDWLL